MVLFKSRGIQLTERRTLQSCPYVFHKKHKVAVYSDFLFAGLLDGYSLALVISHIGKHVHVALGVDRRCPHSGHDSGVTAYNAFDTRRAT